MEAVADDQETPMRSAPTSEAPSCISGIRAELRRGIWPCSTAPPTFLRRVFEFNIYHLLEVADPESLFPSKCARWVREKGALTELAAVIRTRMGGPMSSPSTSCSRRRKITFF